MEDFLDEEMDIMSEQAEEEHSVSQGLSIEDPIKKLNLNPVLKAQESLTLKEAVELLNKKNSGCIVVDNPKGKTVGIFTERDILRKIIGKNIDLSKATLKEFMTPDPEILSENDPIAFALNKMSAGSYRHIPIRVNGEVKYLLSVRDIVDHISFIYRKQVLNLPPDLKQTPSQYGG